MNTLTQPVGKLNTAGAVGASETAGKPVASSNFRIAQALTCSLIALASLASAVGLLIPGLYRDDATFTAIWRGNDLVTLVVAVPLSAVALGLVRRGSKRGQLVWAAMLGYMLYNYAYYMLGAVFNVFFLVYVALFTMSLYALVLVLAGLNAGAISLQFQATTPARWISAFLMFVGISLGGMWIAGTIFSLATEQKPLQLVFALDLSLIVPNMVLGAVLLWKRHPWGYVLGAIMTIKGATYTLALLSMQVFAIESTYDQLTPFYALICLGCMASTWLLLGHLQLQSETVTE